ncbi:MAG: hypothetical protein M3Q75_14525, partial [Gemmatimonadota bacterium]|nr:hypothetical protein [Gemmatimonadota bacterium]
MRRSPVLHLLATDAPQSVRANFNRPQDPPVVVTPRSSSPRVLRICSTFEAPASARRIDVVHAHLGEDLAVLPLAMLAARIGRAPLVITVHC